MRKTISTVIAAFFGGVVAIGGAHFMENNSVEKTSQVTHPERSNYKLVNYNPATAGQFTDFTMAAEKSVNSVVHIKTVSQQVNNLNYDPFAELFFGPQKRQQQFEQHGSGSGVIISHDGYIVTNNHVVAGSDKIEVTLNDKRIYEAELIGTDPSTDVALLKISEKDLPFLNYGNSDAVKVGEWALAVGNPFNLNSTVTAGIISAKGRNNILSGNKRPIESFIQTDAAVNPGNSGGALVNTDGELIGINTAIASSNGAYQGYSFAVPVNIVKKIVSDLVEFGTVQRAYIGVGIQDIDAKFAAEKNIRQLKGIYVNGLTEGGSAQEAGIREGDVITSVQEVPVSSVSELQEQISRYRPGDKISVSVLRNNKETTLPVILKTFDNSTRLVNKSELVKKSTEALGAEFEEMDAEELQKFRLENGLRISRMKPGKLSTIGIQEGFIVTTIDKKKVSTVKDIQNYLSNKTGVVIIEGFYPNGMRAAYSFPL